VAYVISRHRSAKNWPRIDRFIGDQIAMRNTAPGFNFELNVT